MFRLGLRLAVCALAVCLASAQIMTVSIGGDYTDSACTAKANADSTWTLKLNAILTGILNGVGITAAPSFLTAKAYTDKTLFQIDPTKCYSAREQTFYDATTSPASGLLASANLGMTGSLAAADAMTKTLLAKFISQAIQQAIPAANFLGFKFTCKSDNSLSIGVYAELSQGAATCAGAAVNVQLSPSSAANCPLPSFTTPTASASGLYTQPTISISGSLNACIPTCMQTVYSGWASAIKAFGEAQGVTQDAFTASYTNLKCTPPTGSTNAAFTLSASPVAALGFALAAIFAMLAL